MSQLFFFSRPILHEWNWMNFQSNARHIHPQIPLVVMGFVSLSFMQCFENLPLRVQFQSFCFQNTWKAYTHLELRYSLKKKSQHLASNFLKRQQKAHIKKTGTIVTTCIIISLLSSILTAMRTNFSFILFLYFLPSVLLTEMFWFCATFRMQFLSQEW